MRQNFIHRDFLLSTKAARRLYHDHAASEPIFDYHCHLSPRDIAENRRFNNLWEIWLEGDHYKWRAMRTNGVAEPLCTGDAEPYEKFKAWAATVPHTLRNPLYHWTHLELKRYFGINDLLDERSAKRIWKRANEKLAHDSMTPQGILKKFKVKVVGTTDDPTDDLKWHKAIAASGLKVRVIPTFRPDKALALHDLKNWNVWVKQLGKAARIEIRKFDDLLTALKQRHDHFDKIGARASDHGLERAPAEFCTEAQAAAIFRKARARKAVSEKEQEQFAAFIMLFVGRLNAEKGWAMQLHLGAMRNNSSRLFRKLGPDVGFDSIGDWPQTRALSRFLDRLDRENALPKTILYNLDPAKNYAFATMLGNFQDGSVAGKIQLGSGWWFLDQKEGMEWQINALSNLGLLSRFVGMITDSRSFMSFPRHEYFRRTLCNLVGRDMELGELPNDFKRVGKMIRNICYANAREYFGASLADA